MADHVKPTAEELEANIAAAADKIEDDDQQEEAEIVDDTQDDDQEEVEDQPEEEDEPEDKETQDYKKKFTESTREAQVLAAKNKKMNEAIDKAGQITEPTEEELKKEYSDWDDMTATEQRFAKDNLVNKRRFEIIHESTKEFKDIEAWSGKVDSFLEDPKTLVDNPKLERRIEEFKAFAAKPTRRGVDFDDLVSAFLYSVESTKQPAKKGKMIEMGSGGANNGAKPKSDKISLQSARALMKTDYKRYKSLLIAGKIANEQLVWTLDIK